MKNELDFSLPEDGKGKKRKRFSPAVFPTVVSILVLLVLITFVVQESIDLISKKKNYRDWTNIEVEKELAERLENRGLNSMAAQAWTRYLSRAAITPAEEAKYYYRIGKLFQEDKKYEKALEFYYRAEVMSDLPELQLDINNRKQECFTKLGNFGGLKRELEAITSLDGQASNPADVVAEIGEIKITSRELEDQISAFIDMQLAQYKSTMPEDEFARQKEALYDRFTKPENRLDFLNHYITTELLSREAVNRKLDQKPENMQMEARLVKEYYAGRVIEDTVASRAIVTESDLQDYYDSHKGEFTEKPKAAISVISTSKKESAGKAIEELKAGTPFEECSTKYNENETLKESKGRIDTPVAKGSYIPGVGNSADVHAEIFSLKEGEFSQEPVESGGNFYVFRLDSLIPETVRPFDEVKNEVEMRKRRIKEKEVYEELLNNLKKKNNVIIHYSQFSNRNVSDKTSDSN